MDFYNLIDEIDATVMSSDTLADPEIRKSFRKDCERWLRTIDEMERVFPEGPDSDPDPTL